MGLSTTAVEYRIGSRTVVAAEAWMGPSTAAVEAWMDPSTAAAEAWMCKSTAAVANICMERALILALRPWCTRAHPPLPRLE